MAVVLDWIDLSDVVDHKKASTFKILRGRVSNAKETCFYYRIIRRVSLRANRPTILSNCPAMKSYE